MPGLNIGLILPAIVTGAFSSVSAVALSNDGIETWNMSVISFQIFTYFSFMSYPNFFLLYIDLMFPAETASLNITRMHYIYCHLLGQREEFFVQLLHISWNNSLQKNGDQLTIPFWMLYIWIRLQSCVTICWIDCLISGLFNDAFSTILLMCIAAVLGCCEYWST